ncbi:MAG: mechanosensitive ion channel family protein, partial [Gammaproteobacteria bacterium]
YTKTHILRNIGTAVIIFITMAAILMSFSSFRNIGISLLASAGFLTAIIGLSAQKTLFSLSSGLQIALAQPIRLGDTVVIDKDSGVIEEITLTYVTMRMGDRKRLIVPISYFIEKPFENWSHDAKSLRSSLIFNVGFKLPISILRTEFERIVENSPAWDGEVKKLQVADLNEKNVEIRIQISAQNADNLSDLRSEIREKILDFIQRNYPESFPKS